MLVTKKTDVGNNDETTMMAVVTHVVLKPLIESKQKCDYDMAHDVKAC